MTTLGYPEPGHKSKPSDMNSIYEVNKDLLSLARVIAKWCPDIIESGGPNRSGAGKHRFGSGRLGLAPSTKLDKP